METNASVEVDALPDVIVATLAAALIAVLHAEGRAVIASRHDSVV